MVKISQTQSNQPEYGTTRQICEILHISEMTLWRQRREKADFPQPVRIGRSVRWNIGQVLRFIETGGAE